MRPLVTLIVSLIFLSGCYYDHANLVYPQVPCSTGTVTYSKNVSALISSNCSSCHSGTASSGAGIKLDSYTGIKTYVTNGQLLNSINHTGGIPAMPLGAQQLSSCDIKAIQAWITAGTPNN